ncbi:hypothetical protein [Rhizobacter sp. OV335]|uniref:hypothetical protein n=1 Tax=Rhizobacter sp. OV335 TaxID=1500264 RepID=UPI0013564C36|nr:hypothetical protein [Rhizobacter sp. OV335]
MGAAIVLRAKGWAEVAALGAAWSSASTGPGADIREWPLPDGELSRNALRATRHALPSERGTTMDLMAPCLASHGKPARSPEKFVMTAEFAAKIRTA